MARVECAICGSLVNTTANNYVFANGLHQHVKCPAKKNVLDEEEKKLYRELTDCIKWAYVEHKLGDKTGLNWSLITSQIKKLKEAGYSYEDQIYALKWLVDRDGGYWGYGRLEKFIEEAIAFKKKEEKYLADKQAQELVKELLQSQFQIEKEEPKKLKVYSKPTFMDF